MTRTLADIMWIYTSSDGAAAMDLQRDLKDVGAGVVAVHLWRAQKAAERAPTGRKDWSLQLLVDELMIHGRTLGLVWGWTDYHPNKGCSLLVCLPTGQVGFRAPVRDSVGPDYPGPWDRPEGDQPERICRWIAELLAGADQPATT